MGNGKKWNAHDTSGELTVVSVHVVQIAQVFATRGRPIVFFAFIPFSGIEESSCILTCTHPSSLTHDYNNLQKLPKVKY